MEVLHFLKLDDQEVAMILKVEFNEADVRIEDLFPELAQVQFLGYEKESGTYTYFINVRRSGPDLTPVGGYVTLPYGIRDGKVKITSLGSAKQVKDFIKLFENASIRYRVISLTDAKFPPHSLLNRLTEKQRRVLVMAHNLGDYDIPRRISLVQLAERLDLAYSTVDVQLRRAERRLLNP